MNEHRQFQEMVEAYALGALDAQERALLEEHLGAGCAECARAVDEANWLVSQLAHLAPSVAPSELLKRRLLQTVHAEVDATEPMALARGVTPWWLWAGVAALLVFTAYSAWNARQLRIEIDEISRRAAAALERNKELQRDLAAAQRDARILTDPRSRKIMLPATHTQMPELEVMWHPELGICVMGDKVPMPNSKRVFQVWLIPKQGAKPMPMHTLWPDAQGKLWHVIENPPEPMWNTKAIAVTEEPAGGSAQPTSAPMWMGGVS